MPEIVRSVFASQSTDHPEHAYIQPFTPRVTKLFRRRPQTGETVRQPAGTRPGNFLKYFILIRFSAPASSLAGKLYFVFSKYSSGYNNKIYKILQRHFHLFSLKKRKRMTKALSIVWKFSRCHWNRQFPNYVWQITAAERNRRYRIYICSLCPIVLLHIVKQENARQNKPQNYD